MEVLKTIPWALVDIQVISVELGGVVWTTEDGKRKIVHNYLEAQGYEYLATVGVDDMFLRKDLLEFYDPYGEPTGYTDGGLKFIRDEL